MIPPSFTLFSKNIILIEWINNQLKNRFSVTVINEFNAELRLNTSNNQCFLVDVDSIPFLYTKIISRFTYAHSIPLIFLCTKKTTVVNIDVFSPDSLNIDIVKENCSFSKMIDLFLQKKFLNELYENNTDYSYKRIIIQPYLEVNSLIRKTDEASFDIFSGSSARMKEFSRLVKKAAESEDIVLLTGESGCGKTYTAKYIHEHSQYKKNIMQYLNVADIVPSLAESELFGVEKGAYTNAVVKPGIFEVAQGSTLFLDEIGELTNDLQTKFLDVIETKSYMRVGSMRRSEFNARLIFATNADLVRKIKRGQFRKDLFYRIAVLTIKIPALREHIEDLPMLAKKFTHNRVLSKEAMEKLCSYSWPGNIRELKNVIYRAETFCDSEIIRPDDINFL